MSLDGKNSYIDDTLSTLTQKTQQMDEPASLGWEYGDPYESSQPSPLHIDPEKRGSLVLWRKLQSVLKELSTSIDNRTDLTEFEKYLAIRLLEQDALALTWFISSGNLEELVHESKNARYERGRNETDGDLELRICTQLLQRLRRRNKEESKFFSKYYPSIGIENEYRLPVNPQTGYPMDAGAHYHSPERLKPLLLAFYFKREIASCGEIVTHPTASVSSQLREILHLLKLGIIPHDVFSIHITIGGLALSEELQEAQYMQSIMLACGYSSHSTLVKTREKRGPRSVKLVDRMRKMFYSFTTGGQDSQISYVPFILQRNNAQRQESDGRSNPSRPYKPGSSESQYPAVEFRTGANAFGFSNLVREVSGTYYLAILAIAHQKPLDQRDEVEKMLADLWETTTKRAVRIFNAHKISIEDVIDHSYFTFPDLNTAVTKFDEKADIFYLLYEIKYQSITNAGFRSAFRRLLIETKKETEMIIRSVGIHSPS